LLCYCHGCDSIDFLEWQAKMLVNTNFGILFLVALGQFATFTVLIIASLLPLVAQAILFLTAATSLFSPVLDVEVGMETINPLRLFLNL
jgi:hypothetical protein